jgi:Protein of unknown function (DUF732)
VNFLQEQGVVPRYGSPDAAVDLGHAVCTRFDSGGTKADVMQVLTSGQMPPDAANNLMAAAVVGFCPQHAAQLAG